MAPCFLLTFACENVGLFDLSILTPKLQQIISLYLHSCVKTTWCKDMFDQKDVRKTQSKQMKSKLGEGLMLNFRTLLKHPPPLEVRWDVLGVTIR